MRATVIRSLAAMLLAGAAAASPGLAPSGAVAPPDAEQFNPCNPKIKPCK